MVWVARIHIDGVREALATLRGRSGLIDGRLLPSLACEKPKSGGTIAAHQDLTEGVDYFAGGVGAARTG
jgi:hypothetical protein